MLITTANCPSCGAPVTFKIGSSIVVVCEYCNSAVARTDRDVRNLGKVADLIDTQSPLRVGLAGRFDGRPFELTGRVQIAHQAGGVWDEWYASFGGQYWGWLAEAQGRFYMTFPRQVADVAALPPANTLGPGQPVAIPGDATRYVVGEAGVGRLMGAKGEIPYLVQPGQTYAYADLSGPAGAFATLDYRYTPPAVFSGREVTLAELGVSTVVDEFDAEQRRVTSVKLACPHCNGPLELRAPDAAQRVTCPSCNSLLDVDRGNLHYLRTLEQTKEPRFPLGASALFDGVSLTLVGFMVRGCMVEGQWYYWEEYLLYAPEVGFRWLVNGEGGWFFVEPVAPGDVEQAGPTKVRYQQKGFQLKESVLAVVDYVRGEFYWKVEVGEQTTTADYVSREETLSMERSEGEVNWSFGRRVDPAALDRAFDPRTGRANPVALPPPRVVVPPKPLPSMWAALGLWLVFTILGAGVWLAISAGRGERTLVDQSVSFAAETAPPRPPQPPPPDSNTEYVWQPAMVEQTTVVGSFEVSGYRNLALEVESSGGSQASAWLRLVNDRTGEVRTEPLSLGGGRYTGKFESPGPGTYTLYALRRWVEGEGDARLRVLVKEGVTDNNLVCCFPLVLLVGPVVLLLAKAFRRMTAE